MVVEFTIAVSNLNFGYMIGIEFFAYLPAILLLLLLLVVSGGELQARDFHLLHAALLDTPLLLRQNLAIRIFDCSEMLCKKSRGVLVSFYWGLEETRPVLQLV